MPTLAVKHLNLSLEPCAYAKRWQVGGTPFFIDEKCLRKQEGGMLSYFTSATYKLMSSTDEDDFLAVWTDWDRQALTLYRGFPGCHFCWPDLKKGQLKSEGLRDYPEFTMSDTGRGTTCWLPSADLNTAQGVTLQCTDVHTDALSHFEPIPVGFTVAILLGSQRGIPICWLNSGEIVVKGPLSIPWYHVVSITWFDAGIPSFRPWPVAFPDDFLPPQRPYKPASMDELEVWWDDPETKGWMTNVAKHDGALQLQSARRASSATRRENVAGFRALPTM